MGQSRRKQLPRRRRQLLPRRRLRRRRQSKSHHPRRRLPRRRSRSRVKPPQKEYEKGPCQEKGCHQKEGCYKEEVNISFSFLLGIQFYLLLKKKNYHRPTIIYTSRTLMHLYFVCVLGMYIRSTNKAYIALFVRHNNDRL